MNTFKKGINAENKAANILIQKGFSIIQQRIKSRIGEIDILASFQEDYYIVEVKFRKNLDNAAFAVNKSQMIRSLQTFYIYAEKNNLQYIQIYFLAILINDTTYKIINITDLEY